MQTIYLDISNKGVVPTIYAKQGDVGRKFKAVLTDAGVMYAIPRGAQFSVWYSGASGEGNYSAIGDTSAFAVEENVVTVELITQMLNNAGIGAMCMVMNGTDGSQIGMWNISYVVEAVLGADSEKAEQYYTALSEAAANALKAAQTFETDPTISMPGKAADAAATGARIESEIATITRLIAVERQRINQLAALPEGSTQGDAELADIRVTIEGETYNNAGNAIRHMDEKIFAAFDLLASNTGFIPVIMGLLPTEHDEKYFDTSGKIVAGADSCIKRLQIPDGGWLYIDPGADTNVIGYIYDSETGTQEKKISKTQRPTIFHRRYALLNYFKNGKYDSFNPSGVYVKTFKNECKMENGAISDDTVFKHGYFVKDGTEQPLIDCDIHKITVGDGFDYYFAGDTSKLNADSALGCQYAGETFISNISVDGNGKIKISPGCTHLLVNVYAYAGVVYTYKKMPAGYKTATEIDLYTVVEKPFDFTGKKIVAFGDSITVGVTSPNYAITEDSYIALFAKKAGATLENNAVSASTIANYTLQATPIVSKVKEYTGTADVFVIAGGVNDYVTGRPIGAFGSEDNTTTYGALREICEFLKARYPSAKVIFITPVNVTKAFPDSIHPLDEYRLAIQEVALSYGYNVVNGASVGLPSYASAYSDKLIGNADGCHPTALGHEIYANGLTTALL